MTKRSTLVPQKKTAPLADGSRRDAEEPSREDIRPAGSEQPTRSDVNLPVELQKDDPHPVHRHEEGVAHFDPDATKDPSKETIHLHAEDVLLSPDVAGPTTVVGDKLDVEEVLKNLGLPTEVQENGDGTVTFETPAMKERAKAEEKAAAEQEKKAKAEEKKAKTKAYNTDDPDSIVLDDVEGFADLPRRTRMEILRGRGILPKESRKR